MQREHCGAEARCRARWGGTAGAGQDQWQGTWKGQGEWSRLRTVLDELPYLTYACSTEHDFVIVYMDG